MHEEGFKLLLNDKTFIIPINFLLAEDFNSEIFETLKTKQFYQVKSKVHEDTFQSFVTHWIKGIIPNFTEDNISEFEQLSQEFDKMTNIIQMYHKNPPKKEISSLISQKNKLKTEIMHKHEIIDEKVKNNQQIIRYLLNTNDFNPKCMHVKAQHILFKACQNEDIRTVFLMTQKRITLNGITFIIDEESKTADVIYSKEATGDVFIPRSIEYDMTEYIVESIESNAFNFARKIKSVQFPHNSMLQLIGDGAFSESSIERIFVPSKVTKIGKFAFSFCKRLSKVEFAENSQLISIDESAFSDTSIECIFIPQHVKTVGKYAFYSCTQLNNVDFANQSELQSIGQYAFADSALQKILIPSSVARIEGCAFFNCQSLTKVDFSENSELNSIEVEAFCNSGLQSLTIPASVASFGEGWCSMLSNLNEIKVAPSKVTNLSLFEGKFVLGKSDCKSDDFDVLILARRNVKVVSIPPFIKVISSYAFNNCKRLQKVIFSEDSKLISIGKHSFSISTIQNIFFPSNFEVIGEYAFNRCSKLKRVEFSLDSKLLSILKNSFGASALESIRIPSSVTKIDEYAFSDCKKLQILEINDDTLLKLFNLNIFKGSSDASIMLPLKFTHE